MEWSKEKPKGTGFYLWKETGSSSLSARVCIIGYRDGELMFRYPSEHLNRPLLSARLETVADREWLKIPK